jgi:ribosome-associated protein
MIHGKLADIKQELEFRASRSQGPGGQHVNKVNTRIELRFNIHKSRVLSQEEKEQLEKFYRSRITEKGELIIISQTYRSQQMNKQDALERFFQLILQAFRPKRKRIPTRPTRSSAKRRLENKKRLSIKKRMRSDRDFE